MRFVLSGVLAAVALTSLAPSTAFADGVPTPLSRELLSEPWTVIEVNGKMHQSDPALLTFKGDRASGETQCGGSWTAQYTLNLPKVTLFDVQSSAPVSDCESAGEATQFLKALENVKRMRNTSKGLYFFDAKGKRIMVLIAGG